MQKMILGKKLGMSSLFLEDKTVPVTLVEAGPCFVTQIKKEDKEGYNAVQLGFGKAKKINKPLKGHLKNLDPFKYLREFRVEDVTSFKVGQKIDVSCFEIGDKVNVTGISKGRGFSGVIKRHGFSRGPMSHGSRHHREPGSIGSMFPQRVIKGRKLPGHYGNERVTVRNLEVLKVDEKKNVLVLKGAVPGARNQLVIIRKVL